MADEHRTHAPRRYLGLVHDGDEVTGRRRFRTSERAMWWVAAWYKRKHADEIGSVVVVDCDFGRVLFGG